MITGNLDHLDRLAGQLTGPVKKALELLAERDVTELPVGKKLLAGEDIFASVNEYETEPARDRRPENTFSTSTSRSWVSDGKPSATPTWKTPERSPKTGGKPMTWCSTVR